MELKKTAEEKYTALKLLDEKLDSRISAELKSEFINLQTAGTKNLILNLEEVKYVDSSGLSAILTANRLFGASGGVLVLAHINPHVEKLIKISHLDTVLNILPTETEAKEAIYMFELENEITQQEGE